jgi:hypothetical protein
MSFNIIEKNININDVLPGMFIKFSYTKADGSSGEYSVLVVDPNVTPTRARSAQLHGYNVEGVTDDDVIDFLLNLNDENTDKNIRLPILTEQEAYDLLSSVAQMDRPYRSFTLTNIGSISQVTLEVTE